MEDPPDLEAPPDAPGWTFYSLWPRMMDAGAPDRGELALGEGMEVTETAGGSP
jgi:hypothetical protein